MTLLTAYGTLPNGDILLTLSLEWSHRHSRLSTTFVRYYPLTLHVTILISYNAIHQSIIWLKPLPVETELLLVLAHVIRLHTLHACLLYAFAESLMYELWHRHRPTQPCLTLTSNYVEGLIQLQDLNILTKIGLPSLLSLCWQERLLAIYLQTKTDKWVAHLLW